VSRYESDGSAVIAFGAAAIYGFALGVLVMGAIWWLS
jgi:hypothetical protein